jgi:hypothetical protein
MESGHSSEISIYRKEKTAFNVPQVNNLEAAVSWRELNNDDEMGNTSSMHGRDEYCVECACHKNLRGRPLEWRMLG